jgi:predicted nucleotidyltransferase
VLDPTELQWTANWLDARFGLDALWLFGSEARGTTRPGSDLDLAALFRRRPSALELRDARAQLAARLGRDVDLVDLDRASPILAMQVVRHGRLLTEANPARRLRFVAGVPGRYEDLRIVRRQAEQALLERVRRGRS